MRHQPLWLESKEVQQLLNLLVDRLDSSQQRGTKVQSVALNEKSWPLLYKAAFESEKESLWEHVLELSKWGWLHIHPEIAKRSISGYAHSPRISVLDEAALRTVMGRPERSKSALERWRDAVNEGLDVDGDVKKIVGEFCIDIPDRPMSDVVNQINLIPTLAGQSLLLREVSTQLFWGMSKILDKRQPLVAAMLGVDECPFPESPIQLHVYLPPSGFVGALFIENLMSFDQAVRSKSGAFDGLALIYASGFKGSAQRLRSQSGCSIFYSGQGGLGGWLQSQFEEWLFGQGKLDVSFWGDLDHAGMRILSAMQGPFPGITAWERGYALMLESLQGNEGHSPDSADKQGQQVIFKTGCSYADDVLIPALLAAGKFVDQELVKF